jgi:hypothetical protein
MKKDIVLMILGAPWLGYGRLTEASLATICFVYATMLVVAPQRSATPTAALMDLYYYGYLPLMTVPLYLKAFLTGGGLIANINGWRHAKLMRFMGAIIGSMIWTWYAAKLALLGEWPLVFVICVVFTIISIRIGAVALLDLPPPIRNGG